MPLSLSDFIREMSLDSGERSNNGIEMIDAAINSQKEPDFEGFPPKVHLEPAKARSRIKIFTVMTALFFTLFISALNTTIVATAIPTICADLDSALGYAWIGGSYLLANTAAAPVWAKLSDIWGRKLILLTSVAMYFASSIICAVSSSMSMLIVGRALQGTAGGGLTQLVSITISDMFSMRSRTLYLGLLQAMWAVAGGVGPVLGGAFTQYASWRWNFWINLPISGTTFLLLLMFLDVHNPRTKLIEGVKAVDWFGTLSILGLIVMPLLGLNFGGTAFPWNSPKVICLIIFGSFMFVLFIFNEARLARYPIVPLGLFRQKSNVACLLVGFTHFFSVIATEYYLPLYFQSVKEASPVRSGILILPITITEALIGIVAGLIIHRTGQYIEIIWIGVTLSAIGTGLYIYLGAVSSVGEITAFEIVAGIGAGLLFDPPLIALQALVSQDDTATATATLGLIRNLGACLSIVTGGIVFQNGMKGQVPNLRAAGLSPVLIQKLSGEAAAANVLIIQTIPEQVQKLAVKEAFAASLRNLWVLCTCMSVCGVVASGFIAKQVLSKEHTETKTGIEK